MKDELRQYSERCARTWMVCDERNASKVALAFHRFREETESDAAAALLVNAWVQMGGETDEFDRRPAARRSTE